MRMQSRPVLNAITYPLGRVGENNCVAAATNLSLPLVLPALEVAGNPLVLETCFAFPERPKGTFARLADG